MMYDTIMFTKNTSSCLITKCNYVHNVYMYAVHYAHVVHYVHAYVCALCPCYVHYVHVTKCIQY